MVGSLFFRQQMLATVIRKTFAEALRKGLCELLLGSTLLKCTNLSDSYARSDFEKDDADQIKKETLLPRQTLHICIQV